MSEKEMSHEEELDAQRQNLLKRAEADEGQSEEQVEAGIKRIGDIVQDFEQTRYLYVKQLKTRIPYKPLDFGTFLDIRGTKDNVDLGTQMLFHMLHAADDKVTMDDIKKIPINIITEMLKGMTGTADVKGFLPQPRE